MNESHSRENLGYGVIIARVSINVSRITHYLSIKPHTMEGQKTPLHSPQTPTPPLLSQMPTSALKTRPWASTETAADREKPSNPPTPSPPRLIARRLPKPLLHGPRRVLTAAGTRIVALAAAT